MKTFQKKFVALSAVAGLALFGAACEAEGDTEVESPAVETPVEENTVVEGDTTVEGDTEVESDTTTGTDAGTEAESGLEGGGETETTE